MDDEALQRWKASFAKSGVHYETDSEYHEAIDNLVGFIELLLEIDRKEQKSLNYMNEKGDDQLYLIDKNGNKIIL